MGVTKKVLKDGNGVDKPDKGDEVVIDYTGYLYDPNAASNNYMGAELVD
jgi:FK506-binding protein 1